MKRNFLAVSALATVLTGGVAFAQSQNQDGEMAKVQAIMQRAHQQQQQKREQVAQQKEAQKAGANFMQSIIKNSKSDAQQKFVTPGSIAAAKAAKAAQVAAAHQRTTVQTAQAGSPQVQELESQLSQLNQANTTFQQQTDQRIDVLNQEHTVLQGKLAQLSQVLSILNQEVSQLNQQISHAQKELATNLTPQQQQHQKALPLGSHFAKTIETSKTTQYILYAILVLLLIVIMMLIPRRGGYKLQTVTESGGSGPNAANEPSESDTKDEYDFMNSEEAIPAKLDLARAYMAMEDYKSARKVLDQVSKNGSDEQKIEAKGMLDKIPKN